MKLIKKQIFNLNLNFILILIFISLFSLILIFFYKKQSFRNEGFNTSNVEIVVSRYNENLEWLNTEPFNKYDIIVYNKGQNDDFIKTSNINKIINLKNVGKCDHTYLYHINHNYNNLKDITVFLPGSCDMNDKLEKSKKLIENIEENNQAIFISDFYSVDIKKSLYDFELHEWVTSSEVNKKMNSESELEKSPIRPFGKWFETNFGHIIINNSTYQGIFSIAKDDIIQHPQNYYANFENQLSNSSNPEVGHYFERAWAAVFYPMKNTKVI
jgi:hypothetical protein